MKTEIYYFTGTGNSLAITKELAKKITGAKIINIAKAVRGNLETSADKIGIVFPVYFFGLPLMVVDFIKKLKIKKSNYNFAITNYGGMPGASLPQLAKMFKNKGLKLSAGFGIKMPDNYIPLYDTAKIYNKKIMNNIYQNMKKKINVIVEHVKKQNPYKMEKNNFLVNLIVSGLLYNIFAPRFSNLDRKFWANENCNSCKICYKICPAKNIVMKNKLPEWQHKCEQCFACLHWCPKEAIQYSQKTETRSRYQNPNVNVKELFVN